MLFLGLAVGVRGADVVAAREPYASYPTIWQLAGIQGGIPTTSGWTVTDITASQSLDPTGVTSAVSGINAATGSPGSPTGSFLCESAALNVSDMAASQTTVSFVNFTGTTSLTSGSNYCVVAWFSLGETGSAANNIGVYYKTPTGAFMYETSNSGSTWLTNGITNAQQIFSTYSSP